MKKLLTIVIPTYNMEKYLRRCLDSLIIDNEELFETLEVLIINDGSKDSSSTIAHEYQKKYPSVFRVIDKDNGNYGSCVNRGVKEASGKYIKILDADDSFEKSHLKEYIHILDAYEVDLLISDYAIENGEGKIKKVINYCIPENKVMCLEQYDVSCFANIEMHALTYNKKILTECDYIQTEGISYTDQEWSLIPMNCVHNVIYYPAYVYRYYVGREGQTIEPKKMYAHLSDLKMVINKLLSYNNSINKNEWIDKYNSNRILCLLDNLCKVQIINDFDIEIIREYEMWVKTMDTSLYTSMSKFVLDKRYYPVPYISLLRLNQIKLLKACMFGYKILLKASSFLKM